MTHLMAKLDEIEKGLVCLVPNPGSESIITCHEYTICDCEVLKLTHALRLAVEALEKATKEKSNDYDIDTLLKQSIHVLEKLGGYQNCYAINEVIDARKTCRQALLSITQLGLGESGKE